ncbi:D-2-hydroxyacid dehydrogenase [Rossellomorea aquimaris]|uniref:D-2-hydroxyacid dehydrogenase n=1 Tax=Rossellomorea aquimaris TaxID=189382 RepID=UPI001CD477F1|nr:D-2-hydroxyacid dehydrogenase [Rossellomorea aquimaris]MCA1060766.1 D-2-hydroxyacid dehydrogenase [Rossellomorea aquimaris]
MKIIVTFQPKEEFVSDLTNSFPEVEFLFYKKIKDAESEPPNADVIVTMGEDLTDDHIERSKKCKWIMVTSAGLEKMPFEAIQKKGILVTNARGIHKIPMAEFTIGLMLQHAKQLQAVREQEMNAEWSRRLPTSELHGASLLILGAGAIGGEIARLAKAFHMNVSGVNSTGLPGEHFDSMFTLETFNEQLPKADYVVSVLPSTNRTKHILKVDHFEQMKDTAVFINIGRGDLVEESVLLEAAERKLIGHLFLDVFDHEPLHRNHPFWEAEGITVTPHLSSITKKYMPRAFEIFKKNLSTYSNNKEHFINVIDAERGY